MRCGAHTQQPPRRLRGIVHPDTLLISMLYRLIACLYNDSLSFLLLFTFYSVA